MAIGYSSFGISYLVKRRAYPCRLVNPCMKFTKFSSPFPSPLLTSREFVSILFKTRVEMRSRNTNRQRPVRGLHFKIPEGRKWQSICNAASAANWPFIMTTSSARKNRSTNASCAIRKGKQNMNRPDVLTVAVCRVLSMKTSRKKKPPPNTKKFDPLQDLASAQIPLGSEDSPGRNK